MKLPALALFERALRLETRSAVMCWSRAGLLVVILFVLLPVHTMARFGWYGAPGLHFLQEIVWVNLVLISLAGLSYFASAITEEKEEMMLGLLRMTNLNAISILLGKSTSRLFGAILLLLVQVPFILLAVTLGGVGMVQIAAAYGSLLAYMFLLCNLALLFSVVFRNTWTAALAAFVALLLFFFGGYWALGIERSVADWYHVNLERDWRVLTTMIALWREASPAERLQTVFRTGFTGPVIGFQVLSNLVGGVVSFLLAWLVFDWFTRQEKDTAPARPLVWRRASRRSSRIPPRLVGPRAITWKDFTFISGGRFGIFAKILVVGLIVALCNAIAYWTDSKMTLEDEGTTLTWVSIIVTAIWMAIEASRIFKDEVRWKTLSSLAVLPVSMREIAYRKVVGALAGTLPILVCALVGMILSPDEGSRFFRNVFRTADSFLAASLGFLQFVVLLHVTAFLSLVLKRGALPLAIAIQYVGGSLLMGCASAFMFGVGAGSGGPEFILTMLNLGCLAIIVALQFAIGYRLERAAAEE